MSCNKEYCTSLRAFSIFKKSSTFLSIREGDWKSNLLLKTKKTDQKKLFFLTGRGHTVPLWNLIIWVIRILERTVRSLSNQDDNSYMCKIICTCRAALQIYNFSCERTIMSPAARSLFWSDKTKNLICVWLDITRKKFTGKKKQNQKRYKQNKHFKIKNNYINYNNNIIIVRMILKVMGKKFVFFYYWSPIHSAYI